MVFPTQLTPPRRPRSAKEEARTLRRLSPTEHNTLVKEWAFKTKCGREKTRQSQRADVALSVGLAGGAPEVTKRFRRLADAYAEMQQ